MLWEVWKPPEFSRFAAILLSVLRLFSLRFYLIFSLLFIATIMDSESELELHLEGFSSDEEESDFDDADTCFVGTSSSSAAIASTSAGTSRATAEESESDDASSRESDSPTDVEEVSFYTCTLRHTIAMLVISSKNQYNVANQYCARPTLTGHYGKIQARLHRRPVIRSPQYCALH